MTLFKITGPKKKWWWPWPYHSFDIGQTVELLETEKRGSLGYVYLCRALETCEGDQKPLEQLVLPKDVEFILKDNDEKI